MSLMIFILFLFGRSWALFSKIFCNLIHNCRMIISFSGLDGSGKTTQIQLLADTFKEKEIPYSIVQTGRIAIFQHFKKILAFFNPKKVTQIETLQFDLGENKSPVKKVLAVFRQMTTFLDILIFFLIYHIPSKFRKTVLLCDRHLSDSVSQLYYLEMCSRPVYLFLLKLIPQPDVSFYLKASYKTAYQRKPEYPKSYFIKKGRLYSFAAKRLNMQTIPSEDIQETFTLIQNHLRTKAIL